MKTLNLTNEEFYLITGSLAAIISFCPEDYDLPEKQKDKIQKIKKLYNKLIS